MNWLYQLLMVFETQQGMLQLFWEKVWFGYPEITNSRFLKMFAYHSSRMSDKCDASFLFSNVKVARLGYVLSGKAEIYIAQSSTLIIYL